MADLRETKRMRKRLTLKFGIDMPGRVAFTEDISPEGMRIKTALVCPPGSRLKIELTLPDGSTAKLRATVMWAKKVPPNMLHLVKKCGMGVRITAIEAGREGYMELCSELLGRMTPLMSPVLP